MSTTTHIHTVAKVAVSAERIGASRYTEFVFIDASGTSIYSVIAYSEQAIEIDGAEFANFVATAKEPA